MMDWSDTHCRTYFRMLSPNARLYTEMVTTGALIHGDVPRHLDFNAAEHPVALQLGGSEPADLARCAKLGEQWGYDEINLNCGCPSERVQRGAFGACLMAEPRLVADCVKAMQDVVAIPVTVKHRLGLDYNDSYDFVRDFVGTLFDSGCRVFIVHARNAVLKGLSPKDNREVPPLRYKAVDQLKRDFPDATFVLNGGINTLDGTVQAAKAFEGVMLGRAAYHDSWLLAQADRALFDSSDAPTLRSAVVSQLAHYADHVAAQGVPLARLSRHVLGLFQGQFGARRWRQMLSDSRQLTGADSELLLRAAPQSLTHT